MPAGLHLPYQLLFESVPGLYLILSPELIIVDASNAYLEATLTQRDQVTGKHIFEVFPDNPNDAGADGVSNLRASLEQVLRTRAAHIMAVQRYDIRKPDGTFEERFWSPFNKPLLDEKGEVQLIIHTAEDVTDFTRMQANLKETETYKRLAEIQRHHKMRFENILQAMGDAFASINREWKYTFVNNHALALMNKTNDELIGKTLWEVFPDTIGSIFETHYRKVMDEKTAAFFEVHYASYNMWLRVSAYPFDEGIAIFYKNITDQKSAEQEITQLNHELEEKVKTRTQELENSNHELESFTYSVSHDLRAPLRAINGFAVMLEEDYNAKLDAEGKRFIQVIKQNAQNMGLLIDDLLAFSRLGKKEIKKSEIDMHELVQQVVEEISRTAPPATSIKVQKLHPVMGDYSLIKQVIVNLVSNAVKYSSQQTKPVIQISSSVDNGFVHYIINDNGVGFDMQYAHKLFGVFQRLHDNDQFPGTGVGLAIVSRIVTKHGGHVSAKGEPGKGATFSISLPEQ